MLEVNSVSKTYHVNGNTIVALRTISFQMDKPEILGIMGKSGSGKSTLLKIISGLIPSSAGSVKLNGELVTGPTHKIGMVFQDYTAFPWLTVEKNIEFGLRIRRKPFDKRNIVLEKMLQSTDLAQHRKMYPGTLSGGQRQRLAIARALAVEPDVLLMDEPFGSLDESTKSQMHDFIMSIWERSPFKMVFVTHSENEAQRLCHRVILIDERDRQ